MMDEILAVDERLLALSDCEDSNPRERWKGNVGTQ